MTFDMISTAFITFGQRAHQHTKVVGLFELSFTDMDDVGEVFPNGAQQFLTGGAFTRIKAIKRILIVSSLLMQCAEGLKSSH
jgi:hypothetical protein